jgi:hypothetical protein
MKSAIGTMFVVLAIVVAFTAAQADWAGAGPDCSVTVEGTVTSIDYEAHTITVNGQTVQGIPFTYLANQWNVVLVEGTSYVVITAHTCKLTGELRACALSVDGGTVIDFPGR